MKWQRRIKHQPKKLTDEQCETMQIEKYMFPQSALKRLVQGPPSLYIGEQKSQCYSHLGLQENSMVVQRLRERKRFNCIIFVMVMIAVATIVLCSERVIDMLAF